MTSNSDDQTGPSYWVLVNAEDRPTQLLRVYAQGAVESWRRGRWAVAAITPDLIESESSDYRPIRTDVDRRVAAIKKTIDIYATPPDTRKAQVGRTRSTSSESGAVSIQNQLWVIAVGVWALVICAGLLVALDFGLISPSDDKEPIRVEVENGILNPVRVEVENGFLNPVYVRVPNG